MGFIRSVVRGFAKVALHIIYRYDVSGFENIPKDTGALLCSNHIHAFDSVSYEIYIKRYVYAMAKEEFFKNKFTGFFMKEFGCFPVKRGSAASTEAINTAADYLKDDKLVLVFPEGTRNGLKKGVKPKKGAALIALTAGVPVIPIGISGTFKLFSKIKIRVGEPILLEGDTSQENLLKVTDQIMGKISELCV